MQTSSHMGYFRVFLAAHYNSLKFIENEEVREQFKGLVGVLRKVSLTLEKALASNNQDIPLIIKILSILENNIEYLKDSMVQEWGKVYYSIKPIAEKVFDGLDGVAYREQYVIDNVHRTYSKELEPQEFFALRVRLAEKYLNRIAQEAGVNVNDLNVRIERSIEFPPEFQQAGVSILSYFSQILEQKYPSINAGVTIKQKGTNVSMVVELPDGKTEVIEQTLRDYGLVVVGKKKPEELLDNDFQVLQLKQQLDFAAMNHKHTQELLHTERKHYEQRINSLEDSVDYLRQLVDDGINERRSLLGIIKEAIEQREGNIQAALSNIQNVIENESIPNDESVTRESLQTIKDNDPTLFEKINEIIIKGSVSGAAGNFLYSWIRAVIETLN